MTKKIYLDYAATASAYKDVLQAMIPWFSENSAITQVRTLSENIIYEMASDMNRLLKNIRIDNYIG